MDTADLQKAVELVKEKMGDMDAFGATVKFDFGDGSAVMVDGNQSPPAVAADSGSDADCTISAEAEVFQEMVEGELDPTAAFMTGKIKIDGDMSAAMAVARAFG